MSTPRSKAARARGPVPVAQATKQPVPTARATVESKNGHQSFAERLVTRRLTKTKETARARAAGR